MSVLESSFLVYRLRPYHTNISKRVVKTPKVYFTEPGLAVYLLGIESPDQLASHPLKGNLFENLAVMEVYKRQSNQARDPRLFFLRTEKGFEIDLLQLNGQQIIPVEVKSAMTYSKSLVANLEEFCRRENASTNPTLVYDGTSMTSLGTANISAINIRDFNKLLS